MRQGGAQFGLPRLTPVVKWLLLVLGGVFLLQVVVGTALGMDSAVWFVVVVRWGGLYVPTLLQGAVWQPVTAVLLHSMDGWSHLLFNLVTLYFFGTLLEAAVGRKRLIRLLVVAALVSAAAVLGGQALRMVLLETPRLAPTIGASGAISGVMGGVCAIMWSQSLSFFFFRAKGWHLLVGIVVIDLLRVLSGAPISLTAHAAGLLTGLWMFGPHLRPRNLWRRWRLRRRKKREPNLEVLPGGRNGKSTLH